jgi:hypothetical protein
MITKYKNLGVTLSQKEMKEIKGGISKPPPNGKKFICPGFTSGCIRDEDVDCFYNCPTVGCFTTIGCAI